MKRLVPLVLALSACVTPSPDRALHRRAGEHVHHRALAQLWPEAAAFLAERGYAVSGRPAHAALVTQWRQEPPSSRGALRTRYVVEAAAAEGGATLHFFLEEEIAPLVAFSAYRGVDFERRPDVSALSFRGARGSEPGIRRERDLAAEWDFIARVTPGAAERIRAEVSPQAR